jgi:hypothetical protein
MLMTSSISDMSSRRLIAWHGFAAAFRHVDLNQ